MRNDMLKMDIENYEESFNEVAHDVGVLFKTHRDYINSLSYSEYQEFKKRREQSMQN